MSTFFHAPELNHFFVAESESDGVVGCIGLKRHNIDDAELVRMAVSPVG